MKFHLFCPVLFFFLLSLGNSKISKCVCGHVRSQIECQNSGFCIWDTNQCKLCPGQTYNIIHAKISHKKIAENKNHVVFIWVNASTLQIVAFLIKIIVKNLHTNVFLMAQSVFKCQIVKIIRQRMDAKIKIKKDIEKKCRDVKICEELPTYLMSHKMCKEGLDVCTVSEKGHGCIEQLQSCSQYNSDFQCFESKQRQENCFWNQKSSMCIEKVCDNLPFSQDFECKSFLSECTSNGVHCVIRRQCSDAQSKFGCVTDVQGRKCEYHQNTCKIKSCSTASNKLTNYQQCQNYDNLLDCVTSENGGCKIRPEICDGYVREMDCYSVELQDCQWYNNKCEQRQCYHAPIYYGHRDCKKYGNCIGKLNGGCKTTPQICDEILEQQFCELNYNKERCLWLEGSCILLECNKLYLPTYKSHNICQQASQFCTFNIDSLGCTDYLCENILEIEYCTIDSIGTVCTLNQGCIEKKCKSAPPQYDTNQKCETWLSKCTVNVQMLSNNQKILIGCVDKMNTCQQALQDQCYSTLSGFQCKWDQISQICVDQVCTDANPSQYKTNENCKSFKVFLGSCIIGPTGEGCQQWPSDCNLMLSQQQCELNLQNGTKCFWNNSYCKISECSDASKIDYTNNVECNTWLDYCIFNHTVGGCKVRPSSVACTSSPNNSMYKTHQECFAWNHQCTVTPSFAAEGCEQKKQRNCRTNLNGQYCYWDDAEQSCKNEDDDNDGQIDCHKRIYGELSHEDCENFLPKCTLNNIDRYCSDLSYMCDYKLKQQCEITMLQQPCKWDEQNQLCKEVVCTDNTTATTEAECFRFKKFNYCQLKINSNGTFGPGCESRPTFCEYITNPVICKLTVTLSNERCYYFNSQCQVVQDDQCEFITDSKSNELCQLYNNNCVLQSSGQGCYSTRVCQDLTNQVCNSAIMQSNQMCNYSDIWRRDLICSDKLLSKSSCEGQKTRLGQLCQYAQSCSGTCKYQCIGYTAQKTMNFTSSNTLSYKRQQCQAYSSTYIYDTNCNCCVLLTSCNLFSGAASLCNASIAQSSQVIQRCGYNSSNSTCENRKCEHILNATSDKGCYDWKYDCIFDGTSCKTYSGDCTQIKLIYQCQYYACFWQTGKCLNYLDCQLNTNAISNRECLLINAQYCRLNYTKGQGCSFMECDHITNSVICTQTKLVDGSNCKWYNSSCYSKYCFEYTTQSECESSYAYYGHVPTQCYWCPIYSTRCSNSKYCSLDTMIQPKSHKDCNEVNVLQTIYLSLTTKCTVKKQLCSEYTYEDSCVITIDGIDCYWNVTVCINICEASQINNIANNNSSCASWRSYCMSSTGQVCQLLNCSTLTISSECNIFSVKCIWDGSTCITIGPCINYSSSILCDNKSNSQGIPCFWNGTQCTEKTCSNKTTSSLSYTDCNNWLVNCQWDGNNNLCVEDCTQADNTFTSHQQCESYYLNKSCTVKLDLIQCVDLPITCSLAKQTQCYIDKLGNECYFQASLNQCVTLTCLNLEDTYTTHEKCNQRINSCTVNINLKGCQYLDDCNNYLIQQQCVIDKNNLECDWIMNLSSCRIKKCTTAQLILYTAHSCQQYFGDSCTVNANLDGCEIGQSLCMNYNYQQCKSDGQKNLSGVYCFWDEGKSTCLERICENGPALAQSHLECIGFLSTCQKGGCRIKGCFDYKYAIDSACASIFEDKRCVTNGYQCILRNACEDVNIIDGCTFDINLNPCVWIDDKCYTKTCQTASVSLTNYLECNSYLPYCTVKLEGGCTKKQNCQDYTIKEACYSDNENEECIWDEYLGECFSNSCIDFCGDGIISSKEEQCDDGNYLPYDGCYKCQIQCQQGCNLCNGPICQDCYNKGWLLSDGVCISICGDGYPVGKELCDDGNNIEFDGCYQCSYSCHKQCLNCFQGLCVECQKGYQEDGSQCHNVCGDGYIIQELEACDDGNLQNNDGCSDTCKVEMNWKCRLENKISVCNYIILPKIILYQLSKSNSDYQEYQLSFSEQVRLNVTEISEEQFLQMIIVVLENAKDNEYDVEVRPMFSISKNNLECDWIMNLSSCRIKKCTTAQLILYTAHSCQQYFGDSCTVNANLDGCEIGQSLCMNYNYQQCKSDGQKNLSGVYCFWDEGKSTCLERICENGPALAQSHLECIGFLSTCQKGGCRIKGCFDYKYAIDSACASIFEDKRCVTNGYQCILRNACEDVNIIDGCTFDINLNPCVWIDDKCYTKTCQTASVSLTNYLECNSYLPYCTVKLEGGCTKKQNCQDYTIKEACYSDNENEECIWDEYLGECFSNSCIDFCGDGIISSKEEQCDDGNYLPYDGCYKCQIQCQQGCNLCNGPICQDCYNKGWLLSDGVCISICGDGYPVGKELCDDGNNIEFDGCYQCSYSCHKQCLNCFQGLCVECQKGYQEDGSQCHNVCGDGYIIQELEACDDGNLQNNDGCSDTCKVEMNWKCRLENKISVCNYIILPKIILYQLSKSNSDYQEYQLSFSEQVRLNVTEISEEQFLQMIIVVLENAKDNEYDVEVRPMFSISTKLNDQSRKSCFKGNNQV
ncbi:unnamed protein product [Paramecium octaurelia]|uniref:Uncharacterized protein n=1 Tax=Paramecium octaurelia TaxID=43137 RepID=A0A8S1X5I9_PAROT|nr:unnamed protein product [Paramecium octaurelia]